MCATADLLLDLKGPKNKKLGKMKILDSEWMNMAHWRFVWSDILAMFAVPMYSCGFIALMMTNSTKKTDSTEMAINLRRSFFIIVLK